MAVITTADLRRFAPRAERSIATALVQHADVAFGRWGITTAPRLRMFMAQAKVESGGFAVLFEDMNYTAERIHAVWPARFPTVAAALPFAHDPRALANRVYGGRLGNKPDTDDGWHCRGQGLLDTTGRANFAGLAAHMGLEVDDVRARLTSSEGMVECAAATFHMLGCLPFADRGDVIGCTKRLNGGLIGLTARRQAFDLATRTWPTMQPIRPASASAGPSLQPATAAAPSTPAKPALRTATNTAPPTSWLARLLAALTSSLP